MKLKITIASRHNELNPLLRPVEQFQDSNLTTWAGSITSVLFQLPRIFGRFPTNQTCCCNWKRALRPLRLYRVLCLVDIRKLQIVVSFFLFSVWGCRETLARQFAVHLQRRTTNIELINGLEWVFLWVETRNSIHSCALTKGNSNGWNIRLGSEWIY